MLKKLPSLVHGDIQNTNNSYGSLSDDIRLKENIENIRDYKEDFMKIEFKKYNLKENGEKNIGIIANQLEEIFPSLVINGDYKSIKYSILNIIGLSLIQKLIKEVNDLKKFKEDIITCNICKCLISKLELEKHIEINDLKKNK